MAVTGVGGQRGQDGRGGGGGPGILSQVPVVGGEGPLSLFIHGIFVRGEWG